MPNEVTKLTPAEEANFQNWAKQNNIPDVDHPDSFYDYRGFWKMSKGLPHAPGSDQHFPDTFKQHGHPTFSNESAYAKGDGGHWQGDTFVPPPPGTTPTKPDPFATNPYYGPKTEKALSTPLAPDLKQPDTYAGGFAQSLYKDFVQPLTTPRNLLQTAVAGVGELAPNLTKAQFATELARNPALAEKLMPASDVHLPASLRLPVEPMAPPVRAPGLANKVTDTRYKELLGKFGMTEPPPHNLNAVASQENMARGTAYGEGGVMPAPVRPTELATNASGESAASAEALSRQAGMKSKGDMFVVYDRAGQMRPLLGPDAVDYNPRPGETYGIMGPDGFRLLEDKGGKIGGGANDPAAIRAGLDKLTPGGKMPALRKKVEPDVYDLGEIKAFVGKRPK